MYKMLLKEIIILLLKNKMSLISQLLSYKEFSCISLNNTMSYFNETIT